MTTTIRFHQYGAPAVLKVEEDTVGAPGPGQVRLRHAAIGVNFIDTMFRKGVFPMPLPGVTGVEGAGVVEAVGAGVADFQAGDRVAYYLAPGSYADVRLISAEALVPLPDDITFEQAATILTKGLTAWAGLHGFHRVKAGDTVLVQGASGSVGLLLARWARSLGATVIGTAGSEAKRGRLTGSVDHALLSGDLALPGQIRRIAPDGVDVVYELVGKATFGASVAGVRDGGTIVTIGAASGQPAIDQAALEARQIRVVGGPMAQHLGGRAREVAIAAVFDAYRTGVLGEPEVARYPLSEAARAHEDIEARLRTGAMILVP